MNYVWAEWGSMLFHLSVASKRPKLTEIRAKFLLKGLCFHRHGEKVLGKKPKLDSTQGIKSEYTWNWRARGPRAISEY